jgi:hypothetical protein
MLNVIMLSVVLLSVIMLSVVMLNVIILSVLAPIEEVSEALSALTYSQHFIFFVAQECRYDECCSAECHGDYFNLCKLWRQPQWSNSLEN